MISAPIFTAPRMLPLRLPRVCVALAAASAADMFEKAEGLVRDNSLLEFRLDYLTQPASALPKIKRFLELHPSAVVIGTCRRAVNGGKFRGSVASQLEILSKAITAGCRLVDLELQSAADAKKGSVERLRSKAAVILSYHDFRSTKKLDDVLQKMLPYGTDFLKIVTTATSLSDNVTMMKFLERTSDKHSMVGLCMGEQGIISRVLGLRAGSVFTFASVSPGEETAPGQVSARELRDIYRVDHVDAATRVYGVAGDPVSHSLSPLIMNAAFRRENVNGVYLALHAKTLPDLLACVRDIPIHGLSVTMPHKQTILKYLDNTDAHTAKIGACNTVVRAQDGKLYGFNTDIAGVVRPLEQRITLDGAKILVIGAGGAARAAVYGLKERGAEVYIMNRTPAPAQSLARSARARYVRRPDLRKHKFDVIINATPVGMGSSKESPLKPEELECKVLFEMIYSPTETRLVAMARAKGIQIIPGLEMFVHQAARQFEIWTGKPAPLEEMHRILTTAAQASPKKNVELDL